MIKLKELRTRLKITQAEVAAKLQVSRPTYVQYENGNTEPDIDMIIKMSHFFNVSIDELLDNAQAQPSQACPLAAMLSKQDQLNIMPLYAGLNAEGKERLLEYAQMLADNPKYKQVAPIRAKITTSPTFASSTEAVTEVTKSYT